jgi:cell division protein FtsN
MANLDRGAFDSDTLHDFDADQMEDDGGKSRLPLLVLIALVVLAAFGGVVWLAYTQGVERGRADVPKIIVAQSHRSAPRVAPSPYAGLNIYQPSTPAASDSEHTDTVPSPPAPLSAARPAIAPPSLRPSAAVKPELPPLPSPTVLKSKPVQIPAQNPAALPATPPAPHTSEPAPVPAPAKPAVASTNTNTSEPAVASGGVLLQIGSYKSDSEAMQSWNAFKARHAIAAGYRPDIQKVSLGAKGTWYRLRLGALADKKSAAELCEKLKAQGAGCLLAR